MIVNVTTGEAASSVHLTQDGRFDAQLPLAPGVNELRVQATWKDGRSESACWRRCASSGSAR